MPYAALCQERSPHDWPVKPLVESLLVKGDAAAALGCPGFAPNGHKLA